MCIYIYVHKVSLSAVVSEVLELGPGGVESQGQFVALRHDGTDNTAYEYVKHITHISIEYTRKECIQ